MTPLHDAVIRNDLEIVKVLIKFGADPTIKNTKDGKTPIDQAKDKEELLRVLKSSSYLHNNETKSIFTNGLKEEDQSIPINHTEIEEEGKECQDEKVIEEVSYQSGYNTQMMKKESYSKYVIDLVYYIHLQRAGIYIHLQLYIVHCIIIIDKMYFGLALGYLC